MTHPEIQQRPSERISIQWLLVILGVQVLVRALFIGWLPAPAHSFDLDAWAATASLLGKGQNPYRATSYLSWPPFWVQHLFLFSRLSQLLHISLFTVIRVFLIISEAITTIVLFFFIRRAHGISTTTKLLLSGIAVNPIAILLICQHCNFDILMIFWVVVYIYALRDFKESGSPVDWLWACCSLGIAILYKTVPLILAPLLLHRLRALTMKSLVLGILLCLGPALLALSVLYVLEPAEVVDKVIHYRSFGGYFGVTGLLAIAGIQDPSSMYSLIFVIVTAALMIAAGAVFYRNDFITDRTLVLSSLLLLLWVIVFGPGYGPQYGYWYLPLMLMTFFDFGRGWRTTLVCCYLVASITYIEEYGLLESHGMFLVYRGMSRSFLGIDWSNQASQTLARLPLFFVLIWVLFFGTYNVFRELMALRAPAD